MTGRRLKAALLVVALVVLAVEGYLLYGYYDHQYDDASSGTGVSVLEETTGRTATGSDDAEGPGASEAAVPPVVEDGFVHRATEGNSRGDYTYLSEPRIDGNPNAVILAEPSGGGVSSGDATYDHNVGVWFEPGKKRWAIFNQDLAAVPPGAAFEVVVPPADQRFVHRSALLNIVDHSANFGRRGFSEIGNPCCIFRAVSPTMVSKGSGEEQEGGEAPWAKPTG